MATRTVTPQPAEMPSDAPEDRVRARLAVRRALDGKLNCVGDVSLTADGVAITTDVLDPKIVDGQTLLLLTPSTLAAAAEVGAGTLFVTYPAPGTARINHAAAVTVRTFRYGLLG